MIKQIALVTAKAGMGRDAFVRRYEQFHAPLALEILNFFCGYRRNYIVREQDKLALPEGVPILSPAYDAISEFWFPNETALQQMATAIGETDAGLRISEDETKIFDRSKIRMFGVDEYFSKGVRSLSARVPRPAIKIFIQASKNAGMSRKEFLELCEAFHAPMIEELIQIDGIPWAGYRRSYPIADSNSMPHLGADLPPLGFDLLSELTFETPADYERFRIGLEDSHNAEALAKIEATVFDVSSLGWFNVDEHATSPDLLGTSICLLT